MNANDRKVIREYLETVTAFGELPYGLTVGDMDRRGNMLCSRQITTSGDAKFISEAERDSMPGDASRVMCQRMEDATRRMRREMTQPLPYTPEPPEFRDLCVCGYARGEHLGDNHDGIGVLAKSYPDKYSCPGFTPTSPTTTEEKGS